MEALIQKPTSSTIRPEDFFGTIAAQKGAIWLDSSLQIGDKGRCSFIAHSPVAELSAYGNRIELSGFPKQLSIRTPTDPFSALSSLWKNASMFSVGYISYEATLPFVGIKKPASNSVPLIHFFFYDSALRFDHSSRCYSVLGTDTGAYGDLLQHPVRDNRIHLQECKTIAPTISRDDYFSRLKQIREHIKEGDIYQANFTCRFDVFNDSSPYDIYRRLRNLNPAPYAAYLNFGDYQILSSSPERMLIKENSSVSCCPIKGTIAAGKNLQERQRNRLKLLNSEKDKAELLMIVDLVRNDLGKVARTGTVRVDNLFNAENYSSVIHLIANVSAELETGVTMVDLLSALLPGGSITGAPKKRAVEILNELETRPRGVYTGCIGYVNGNTADFNIAIRTLTHESGVYYINAGGGIVADSIPELECQEMMLKSANLFKALGAEKVPM